MPRLSAKSKAQVYANLEKYARSGMGLEKACDSLLSHPRLPSAERRLYRGLREGLRQGRSIGEALGTASASVSPLEREVVMASEMAGQLEKGFAHLSLSFRRWHEVRRRMLKGLVYPLVLLHLAIPVGSLTVTALRRFRLDGESVAEGFGPALATCGWGLLGLWVGLLLAAAVGGGLHRLGRKSAPVDALLGRIPFVGKARRAVALERFTQVFEIFLLSGRPMSEALSRAALASGSGQILAAGKRGAGILASGEALATVLFAEPGAFPDDFARGLAAAEESGQLDRELANWARHYADAAAEAIEDLGKWVPQIVYWGALAFVVSQVLRVALAYRGLLDGLSQFEW